MPTSSPTSSWRKSPEELAAIFRAALPAGPGVERRQMFGYPAAFVNGNMATGLHQEQVIVRLPAAERKVLLAKPGARTFEPMPGRPMVEYIVVPPNLVVKAAALRGWIVKAVAYARSLPPKIKKGRPPKKASVTDAEAPAIGPPSGVGPPPPGADGGSWRTGPGHRR
jgi:TfoX/Sxy family transcriptional regulator of competence genes